MRSLSCLRETEQAWWENPEINTRLNEKKKKNLKTTENNGTGQIHFLSNLWKDTLWTPSIFWYGSEHCNSNQVNRKKLQRFLNWSYSYLLLTMDVKRNKLSGIYFNHKPHERFTWRTAAVTGNQKWPHKFVSGNTSRRLKHKLYTIETFLQ